MDVKSPCRLMLEERSILHPLKSFQTLESKTTSLHSNQETAQSKCEASAVCFRYDVHTHVNTICGKFHKIVTAL